MDELQQSLREYRESLADVEALLAEDGDSEELLQVRDELRASIRLAEESLAEPEPPAAALDPPPAAGGGPPLIGPPPAATPPASRAQRNARVHPRNKYAAAEPDFAALAAKDPGLAPFVRVDARGRGSIDFADAAANRELTRALLAHDYGIAWSVGEGQLIPAVTNRANYIHWLQDLLQLASPPGPEVRGLDVGCGANLIYCLLGAALCNWRMVGVDVTDAAAAGAAANVALNPRLAALLELRMRPREGGPEAAAQAGILLPAVRPGERFAFCMCNPPFFASLAEAGQNPGTAHEGTAAEMVWPGGEAAFVGRMVQDSLELQDRIFWYTSMVGKKATLKALRQQLHRCGVAALRVTEFAQGRTSRWGIAWSFAPAARGTEAQPLQAALPRPARRQTVLTLERRGLQPAAVLHAAAAALEAAGAACAVEAAAFRLSAEVPLPAGADGEPQAKRQRTGDGPAGYRLQADVLLERPGVVAVRARIPADSGAAAARHFTDLLAAAEGAARGALGLDPS